MSFPALKPEQPLSRSLISMIIVAFGAPVAVIRVNPLRHRSLQNV
jgi:hypothetical protein